MPTDSDSNIQTEKKALVEAYFSAADATLTKTQFSPENRLCDIRHRELLLRDVLQD